MPPNARPYIAARIGATRRWMPTAAESRRGSSATATRSPGGGSCASPLAGLARTRNGGAARISTTPKPTKTRRAGLCWLCPTMEARRLACWAWCVSRQYMAWAWCPMSGGSRPCGNCVRGWMRAAGSGNRLPCAGGPRDDARTHGSRGAGRWRGRGDRRGWGHRGATGKAGRFSAGGASSRGFMHIGSPRVRLQKITP